MTLPWIPPVPVHTTVLGATRSGKTSSTLRQLLLHWLSARAPPPPTLLDRLWGRAPPAARAPPGLIAQCVKPDEGANLAKTLAVAGRAADTVRVRVGGPWHCDPLYAYFGLRGRSVAGAARLVSQLSTLVDRFDRGGSEPFWRQSAERLLFMAIAAIAAAAGRATFDALYRFLASLPTPETIRSGAYEAGFAHEVISAGLVRDGGEFKREFAQATAYFTGEFLALPDRTRESVRPHAMNVAFPFTVEPVAGLCDGPQTLSPQMLTDGACILTDVSVLTFGLPALLWQSAFKVVCDYYLMDQTRGGASTISLADEYQWLCLPEHDLKVQTTSGEAGYVQLKAFQTIPVLVEAVSGDKANEFVAGLLANSQMVACHNVANCAITADLISKQCGDYKERFVSVNTGGQYDFYKDMSGNHTPGVQVSVSENYQPRVRPHELSQLPTGGPKHHWRCGALVLRPGRPHLFASVPQVILPED